MSVRMQERDIQLLEALALRVRLFGQRQIAEAFRAGHMANTRRRLSQLVNAGFLLRSVVNAQPLPELLVPIVRWQPGQPEPDVQRVSHQLQSRWRFRALRPTVVYFPTATTIAQFGGRERPQTMLTHITHDLGVAAIWLRFQEESRSAGQLWIGEDVLAPHRVEQKLPDAALVDADNNPVLLIEFGGSYSPQRVRDFHDDAAARHLPYQLW